jgi:hypothetical protein
MDFPILDIALSMVFVYLVFSLVVSGLAELLQMLMKSRENFLFNALSVVFNDRWNLDYVYLLYTHPLVDSLKYNTWFRSGISPFRKRSGIEKSFPAYIPGPIFASALIETVAVNNKIRYRFEDGKYVRDNEGELSATLQGFSQAVQEMEHSQARILLSSFLPEQGGSREALGRNIEQWFNMYMGTVSSWYKRRMTMKLIAIGFFMALALNLDSIGMFQRLWKDKTMRQATVTAAETYVRTHGAMAQPADLKAVLKQVETGYEQLNMLSVPLGWNVENWSQLWKGGNWFFKLIGCLLTGLVISYGSDILFNILARLINIRSSVKPKE